MQLACDSPYSGHVRPIDQQENIMEQQPRAIKERPKAVALDFTDGAGIGDKQPTNLQVSARVKLRKYTKNADSVKLLLFLLQENFAKFRKARRLTAKREMQMAAAVNAKRTDPAKMKVPFSVAC